MTEPTLNTETIDRGKLVRWDEKRAALIDYREYLALLNDNVIGGGEDLALSSDIGYATCQSQALRQLSGRKSILPDAAIKFAERLEFETRIRPGVAEALRHSLDAAGATVQPVDGLIWHVRL